MVTKRGLERNAEVREKPEEMAEEIKAERIRERKREASIFPFHIFDCVLFSPTCLCLAGGEEKSNEK